MLRVTLPAGLGFQLPRPEGLPDTDTPRTRMVRILGWHPDLALPDDEKDALFGSLSLTLGRVRYHYQRFLQVISALNERRKLTGALVTFDVFAHYTQYEASATLGAIRSGVDELIFITARLAGTAGRDAHDRWKATDVLSTGFDKRPDFDVPAVHALRARKDWYDELNEYRNVSHHRGWHSPFGAYFPLDSALPEARDANHSVMLVPDRGSLINRSRPHEWTYTGLTRLEHVVERAVSGFDEVIDAVCMGCWGGTIPAEGTVPKDQCPNVFILLAVPILLGTKQDVVVPIFTTREAAHAFRFPDGIGALDLVEVLPTSLVAGEPAFSFALPALRDSIPESHAAGSLLVLFDPRPGCAQDKYLGARSFDRLRLQDVFSRDDTEPFSLMQNGLGVERVFVWRRTPVVAPASAP